MKCLYQVLLLVFTTLISGCAAVEYGLILNGHRGDLMSLNAERGKRFYDIYLDTLFFSPPNSSVARKHLKEHGFPDFIYCEGQLSNYLIYDNENPRIFHFDQWPIGFLKVSPIAITGLPLPARQQLSLIKQQVQQIERQELEQLSLIKQQVQQIERQELEERWKNEYLLDVSESGNQL